MQKLCVWLTHWPNDRGVGGLGTGTVPWNHKLTRHDVHQISHTQSEQKHGTGQASMDGLSIR